MAKFTRWLLAFQTCMLVCRIAAGQDATEDTILPGQQVTVITADAQFTSNDKIVGRPRFGESFTVENIKGDSIFIKSRNAFLSRYDVVPYDDAIDYFTDKIKEDPCSYNCNARGLFWEKRGEYGKAIADYSNAIRLDPNNVTAHVNRGNALKHQGQFDKAIADFDEATRLDPKSSSAYLNRGLLWYEKGDNDKGIADFNRAIGLNSGNPLAYNNRAAAWYEKGDLDKALTDFNIAIRLDSNYANALINRAGLWIEKGEYDKAQLDYKEVIRIDRARGLNDLAWQRATSPFSTFRDGENAIRDATEACELTDWKNWAYINTLSAALAEAGRFDEAIKRLQQSNDMNPDPDAYKDVCDSMMTAFKASKTYTSEPSR